ncbi:MAG: hypothetical protein ACLP6G_17640 [Terriglobales bacterium]
MRSCQCGTVFELTQSGGAWAESVIHSFGSVNGDGSFPDLAGLLLGESGAVVGTTPQGGAYDFGVYAGGTVFGLLPPSSPGGKWTYGVLYSFGELPTDGQLPQAGVISVNGVLYGTTSQGGSSGGGPVSVDPHERQRLGGDRPLQLYWPERRRPRGRAPFA